jgi:putative transposase
MHQNLFQRNETAELLLRTIFRYRDANEFLVHEYVIMPNHLHLLLSLEDGHSVGRAMQLVKGGFSHATGQAGSKLKAVWQPSYYEHRVRDNAEYVRIRTYIHENPVRRCLVEAAEDYRYTSANTSYRLNEIPDRLKPGSAGLQASVSDGDTKHGQRSSLQMTTAARQFSGRAKRGAEAPHYPSGWQCSPQRRALPGRRTDMFPLRTDEEQNR